MSADVTQTIATGSLPLAMLLALAAGIISFASPCVLPLVPGFLGYVTGLDEDPRRSRLMTGALLFVLGFSVVFVSVSLVASAAAQLFVVEHQGLLIRLGGVVVILFGLIYLGLIGRSGLPVRWRPAAGLAGAPLLGAAFGLGMAPCASPVLGTIVAMNTAISQDSSSVPRGVALACLYSLGMGLPFLLIAAGWGRAERASRWLRDRHRVIQVVGGTLMIVMGVLMVSGVWEQAMAWVQTQIVAFRPVI